MSKFVTKTFVLLGNLSRCEVSLQTLPLTSKHSRRSMLLLVYAESVERNIWQGKYAIADGGTTGTYNNFAGIMNHIVAGAPAVEDLLTGVTTTANILGRLTDLSEQIPDALAGDPDTKLYMSRGMKQLYYGALAGTAELTFHAC